MIKANVAKTYIETCSGGKMKPKHLLLLMIILTVVFFPLFFRYLPLGTEAAQIGHRGLQILYSAIMGITASTLVILCMLYVVKRDYVIQQWQILNRFKYLLHIIVKRDFVTRYRKSTLGVLWSLLNPLFTMLVLNMVFSMLFRFEIPHFPVYLLSGQMIFIFFSEATTGAMGSITGNAGIIKKVYVPKYIFPVSRIFSALVNLAFAFVAFLIVVVITGAPLHWTIVLFPIPIFYTFLFALGVGMLLSCVAVFFRDISHIYGIFTTLLMFMTPIMYPVSILPDRVFQLMHLNPLYHYITFFRALALDGVIPGFWVNIVCLGFALLSICVGLSATVARQDKYILYL